VYASEPCYTDDGRGEGPPQLRTNSVLRITSYGEVTRFDLARTLLGRGRYWTTAYLVDRVLVDTGCAHSAPELVAALDGRPLHRIINTHTHEDHIGANARLQRQRTGLEILAHPLALPVLADPRREQPLQPYRRVMWGWPEACVGRPVSDGDVIETANYRFHVLHTPGHSPDHLCLFEPEHGWLFTGDLFVGGRDRALRGDNDIWQIIASLKRIAQLPARTMFPGSARVRENPSEALGNKITHLEQLGAAVLALDRQGWGVPEIVGALCGGPMWIEIITLGHFSRRHLVSSYLGINDNLTPPA
jgi:glyoxylase-like metal-dependent hydrolase (beta-lactamase superfamily II)